MRRAILVTTSTAVGIAAVLSYKPNSDLTATMLDLTGANMDMGVVAPAETSTTEPATAAPASTPNESDAPASSVPATKSPKPAPRSTRKPANASTAPTEAAQSNAAEPATQTNANRTVVGDPFNAARGSEIYGQVVVTVRLVGSKMTDVSFTETPSARNERYISAVRQYLIPAVLQAQSANVGYVSGATATSEAFAKSLQSALNKA